MKKFFVIVLLFAGVNAAQADLFRAGGGYSRQYGGFGFDPWITNTVQPKNLNRPELGLYGRAAEQAKRERLLETGMPNRDFAPIPYRNKNIYVD